MNSKKGIGGVLFKSVHFSILYDLIYIYFLNFIEFSGKKNQKYIIYRKSPKILQYITKLKNTLLFQNYHQIQKIFELLLKCHRQCLLSPVAVTFYKIIRTTLGFVLRFCALFTDYAATVYTDDDILEQLLKVGEEFRQSMIHIMQACKTFYQQSLF